MKINNQKCIQDNKFEKIWFCVVIDKKKQTTGIFTDGDIKRAIRKKLIK